MEDKNHNQTVTIDKNKEGYVVKVGCQSYFFKTVEEALKNVELYFNKPITAVRKFLGEV